MRFNTKVLKSLFKNQFFHQLKQTILNNTTLSTLKDDILKRFVFQLFSTIEALNINSKSHLKFLKIAITFGEN